MAADLQRAIDSGELSQVKELFGKYGSKLCSEYIAWDTQRKESPVHRAINQDRTEIALFLLGIRKHQVSNMVKHPDFRGETPLHRCGWCGRASVAKKLIKLGAKVNSTNALGLTPLHLAAEREKLDVVELLIKNKASVNARSLQGNTPLHRAITTGNERLILTLVHHNADPDLTNQKGIRAGGKYSTADLKLKAQLEFNSTPSKVSKSKSVRSKERKKKRETKDLTNDTTHSTLSANKQSLYNVDEAKLIGMDLSFYEIQPDQVKYGQQLGEGGFGTVYEGTVAGQHVALKQLTSSAARIHENFRKELDVMCELRHPNIVLLLGAVVQPDQLCLVMELCQGGSLTSLLRQRELKINEVISISRQVALAMNWLHSKDPPILHLDLKPANILLSDLDKLQVKVSDFGLARSAKSDSRSIVGTRRFMAPEMMRKLPVTEKSDVYSFGILIWQIFARKKPFSDFKNIKSPQEKKDFADFIWSGGRPTISLDMPPLFANLLRQTWSNDPNSRPNFSEIIQWLDQILLYETFSDNSAQVFWSLTAAESYDRLSNIRWKQLKTTLSSALGDNDSYSNFLKELKNILCEYEPVQSETVSMVRFSALANSFAPFNPVTDFMNRVASLSETFYPAAPNNNNTNTNGTSNSNTTTNPENNGVDEYPIFYAFTDEDCAVSLLHGAAEGTFLVRNTEESTIEYPFILSYVSSDSVYKHAKIFFDSTSRQYSIGNFSSQPNQLLKDFLAVPVVAECYGLKYAVHSLD